MKLLIAIASCYLLFLFPCVAQIIPPHVSLDVRVVGEDGFPVENAQVGVGYPGRISGQGESYTKNTDENGVALFSGSSILDLSVRAVKDGYYYSHKMVRTFERVNGKNVYSDQEVELILRPRINPIPMIVQRVQVKTPELDKPIGFDLMKGDWVAPHGRGESEDFSLEMTGTWNGFRDHDSVLKITFPNAKDGIVPFTPHEQSEFKSPHEAPLGGYRPERSWRKTRRPAEGVRDQWESVDETADDANFIFRVQSILDEEGNIKSAHYGKIYGGFQFDGATLDDDRYNVIIFSYYLNPAENDRNLEFDPKKNLVPERRGWSVPREP